MVDLKKHPTALVSGDHSLLAALKAYFKAQKIPLKNLEHYPDDVPEVEKMLLQAAKTPYAVIFLDGSLKSMAIDVVHARLGQNSFPATILVQDDLQNTQMPESLPPEIYLFARQGVLTQGVEAAILGGRQHWTTHQALRAAKLEADAAKNKLSDFMHTLTDWVWEADSEMKIRRTEKGRCAVPAVLTKGVKLSSCFLPEEKKKAQTIFAELCQTPRPFYDQEYWGLDGNGMRVCWAISGTPVFEEGTHHFLGYHGFVRDISAEKANKDQLYFLANNDPLTGVYNRGRFYDELKRALRLARRQEGVGGLLLLDVDRFKYMNDTFGHDAGDGLLVHVAHILREVTAGQGIVARLGGDEFAIVVPSLTPEGLEVLADHIIERIHEAPFLHDGRDVSLSVSMGAVLFPEQGRSAGELLSKADIAMYRAKGEGRNRWYLFDEKHLKDHSISKRLEVVDFINKALEDGRLYPFYQPIVPLQKKARKGQPVTHYEVLCRMKDEDGGLVLPYYFIETAEDFGLIQRIDEHMCRDALRFLKARHRVGDELTLSINLSGITFDDHETMARIRALVQEANLAPGHVIFEITETTALRDLGRAQHAIRALKKVGCRFALDDFGVGYSSFSYVRHLDIDYVKIDGSFIRQINNNLEDRVFVKALNDVAKGMGIQTIAEMVEDEDAENHIRAIGVDYGQGYHFGRPAPHLLGEMEEVR